MADDEQIELTFRVPDQDFDAISLDTAMMWIASQLGKCRYPSEEHGGRAAYRILHTIHSAYMDAIGHPEWKKSSLIDVIDRMS